MRLCVNQKGERQDSDLLGDAVYETNVLTVIASESYKDFSEALQKELAESISSRPTLVTESLFEGVKIRQADGELHQVTSAEAWDIFYKLLVLGYIDQSKTLTSKYFEHKQAGTLELDGCVLPPTEIVKVLDRSLTPQAFTPRMRMARQRHASKKIDLPRRSFRLCGSKSTARPTTKWTLRRRT